MLLGVVGVAACTPSAEECTAADAAQQYAQLLPVATKARDVRPDLSGCKRTGIASFYADMFTGREMADGTRMDPNADNAASRTLPLGTTAKVTNLETGQSAEVTIQDRGPYVKGRIIDLSPATAREIGLDRQDGLATVVVAPIEVPLPDGGVKQGAARPAIGPGDMGGSEPRSSIRTSQADRGISGYSNARLCLSARPVPGYPLLRNRRHTRAELTWVLSAPSMNRFMRSPTSCGAVFCWVRAFLHSLDPRDTYVREKRTLRITYGIENPAAGSDYLCGRAKGIDAAARLDAAGPFDGEWYQPAADI